MRCPDVNVCSTSSSVAISGQGDVYMTDGIDKQVQLGLTTWPLAIADQVTYDLQVMMVTNAAGEIVQTANAPKLSVDVINNPDSNNPLLTLHWPTDIVSGDDYTYTASLKPKTGECAANDTFTSLPMTIHVSQQ